MHLLLLLLLLLQGVSGGGGGQEGQGAEEEEEEGEEARRQGERGRAMQEGRQEEGRRGAVRLSSRAQRTRGEEAHHAFSRRIYPGLRPAARAHLPCTTPQPVRGALGTVSFSLSGQGRGERASACVSFARLCFLKGVPHPTKKGQTSRPLYSAPGGDM